MIVGWTENEADGAIPNGTLVEKVSSEPGDAHDVGDRAKVVGSIYSGDVPESEADFCYWVAWEDLPDVPIFVSGHKIAPVGAEGE